MGRTTPSRYPLRTATSRQDHTSEPRAKASRAKTTRGSQRKAPAQVGAFPCPRISPQPLRAVNVLYRLCNTGAARRLKPGHLHKKAAKGGNCTKNEIVRAHALRQLGLTRKSMWTCGQTADWRAEMFSPIRARASFVGLTALTLLASSSALTVEAYAQATGAPAVAPATPGTGAATPGQGQATGTGASSESKGPCKATITFPAFGGVIKQNPDPACFTLPGAGEIYLGGALTGYAYRETNPFPFTTPP